MKHAIYLIGNVGSGKDFLLRNTPLKSLKEIHNDRLSELYNSGHRLSDNRIVVNCTGEDLEKIVNSKHLLETSGYKTLGIFVYTTDEVSKMRNEARRKPGSRIINETLRAEKYRKSCNNIAPLTQEFRESFLIYNNSYSDITQDVRGWLEELREEINSFLSEQETPYGVTVTGEKNRGTGEGHATPEYRSRLDSGKAAATGTHPRKVVDHVENKDEVTDNKSDNGKLQTETFDANKAHGWANRLKVRLQKNHTRHMGLNGIDDHPRLRKGKRLLKNSFDILEDKKEELPPKRTKQLPPPPTADGFADGGTGMTASGDQAVNEFFDSGIKHPVDPAIKPGKNPSTPMGVLGGKTSLGGYNWAASLSVLPDATELPARLGKGDEEEKTTNTDGRASEGGALSGGGVPGGAQNEARKYKSKPVPPIKGDASISGSSDGGGAQLLTAIGTLGEAKGRVGNKRLAKVYNRQAQKRAKNRGPLND